MYWKLKLTVHDNIVLYTLYRPSMYMKENRIPKRPKHTTIAHTVDKLPRRDDILVAQPSTFPLGRYIIIRHCGILVTLDIWSLLTQDYEHFLLIACVVFSFNLMLMFLQKDVFPWVCPNLIIWKNVKQKLLRANIQYWRQ